jgi:predicted nucleic acid-binding protein
LDEPDSGAATALRDEDLIAPVLRLAEPANALCWRARIGEIPAEEAIEGLSELADAPVASLAIQPHLERALSLATEIALRFYDCICLAMALHHGTQVAQPIVVSLLPPLQPVLETAYACLLHSGSFARFSVASPRAGWLKLDLTAMLTSLYLLVGGGVNEASCASAFCASSQRRPQPGPSE